jgi:hypothetical protein
MYEMIRYSVAQLQVLRMVDHDGIIILFVSILQSMQQNTVILI